MKIEKAKREKSPKDVVPEAPPNHLDDDPTAGLQTIFEEDNSEKSTEDSKERRRDRIEPKPARQDLASAHPAGGAAPHTSKEAAALDQSVSHQKRPRH